MQAQVTHTVRAGRTAKQSAPKQNTEGEEMDTAGSGLVIMIIVISVVAIVITVLWVFLPILIMGTNGRLDKILTRLATFENPDAKTQIQCPECLSYVPKSARKCRHCTSSLAQVSQSQSFPSR